MAALEPKNNLLDFFEGEDVGGLASQIMRLPENWGLRVRALLDAANKFPVKTFSIARQVWDHEFSRDSDQLFVRSHVLVLISGAALKYSKMQRSQSLFSTVFGDALPQVDISATITLFASALTSPVFFNMACRLFPTLYPLDPDRWTAIFSSLDSGTQVKCASALAHTQRKYKFDAHSLFDQWLDSNPRFATLFLHCASKDSVENYFARDIPAEVTKGVKWEALWRTHPNLSDRVCIKMLSGYCGAISRLNQQPVVNAILRCKPQV